MERKHDQNELTNKKAQPRNGITWSYRTEIMKTEPSGNYRSDIWNEMSEMKKITGNLTEDSMTKKSSVNLKTDPQKLFNLKNRKK